jgi:hypothetical protein
VPEPGNPQSLNRFSYVLENPLRYRDPTGHWDEKWEEQFEAEHGKLPTEQDWWDYQFSRQFDEWIAGFWAYTASLRALLWNAGVTIQMGDIGWRIAQAETVGEAVKQIGKRFGGDVRRFIGGVTVILETEVRPWWTPLYRRLYGGSGDYNAYEEAGKIHIEPDALGGLEGLVHEMGHYFDEKKGHSLREYKKHLRLAGLPTTNVSENFANAFAAYVLRTQIAPTKEEYLNQFRVGVFPHAGGYYWLRR